MRSMYSFEEYVQQLQQLQSSGWSCTPRELWSIALEMQSLAINVRDDRPEVVNARDLLSDAYATLTEKHRHSDSMDVPSELALVNRLIDSLRHKIECPVLTLSGMNEGGAYASR